MSGVHQESFSVSTHGRDKPFYDLTDQIADIVSRSKIANGVCAVFVQHTSASLVIQENADPRVLVDLQKWMNDRVPEGPFYVHDDEGPDDMPGHIKSAITKTSEVVPVTGGKLALGTWQAIYLWEHRRAPHRRTVVVTVMGAAL
jgi:secondary thiamine-phosphate synthase enzyme